MIERVARALCKSAGNDPDALEPGNDPYHDNTSVIDGRKRNGDPAHFLWRQYVGNARAAIEAIREPIVDALKPFADCAEELDGSEYTPRAPDGEWAKFRLLTDDYRRAREVVAMIDAALK